MRKMKLKHAHVIQVSLVIRGVHAPDKYWTAITKTGILDLLGWE